MGLYEDDDYFASILRTCEKTVFENFFRHDGFLFKENKFCVLKSSLRNY